MPYTGTSEEIKEKKHKYYVSTADTHLLRTIAWKKSNPDLAKDHSRKTKLKQIYGISLEQYDELLKRQNDCCAVCKRHKTTFNKRLCVDHDHKSGEIRGLLCLFCNRVIVGRLRGPEGVQLFLNASEYLKGGTSWIVPPKIKRKKRRKKK